MTTNHTLWVTTANDLAKGNIVFLSESQQWQPSLERAQLETDEQIARERLQELERDSTRIVDPYLVEVTASEKGSVVPVRFRERMRLVQPTQYM